MEAKIHLLLIDGSEHDIVPVERELRSADFKYRASRCSCDHFSLSAFLAKADRPDAVLCPFSLTGTNAVKVYDSLRDNGCDAPFILLAFDLAEDIAIELLDSGMEDYVMRNSLKRLPVIIRKAIQRHEINMELRKSREEAKSSELALRSMVSSTPMPVVMLDRDLLFIVASETWYILSNRVGAELEGVHYSQVVPGQHEHWVQLQKECLMGKSASNEGESFVYEGKNYWTRWRMNPWYEGDGKVGGIVIFSEDITEQKELLSRIRASEDSLREAHRIAKLGDWSWRVGTSVVWCSDETIGIFGLDMEPGAVKWSDMLKRMHPEDRELVNLLLSGDLRSGFSDNLHFRVVMPDGEVRHIMSCARLDRDSEGRPYRLVGTVQDQTAEKLKDQEKEESKRILRQRSEQLELAMSAAHLGTWTWKCDSMFCSIDMKSSDIYGIDGPEVSMLQLSECIHPDDRDRVTNNLQRSLVNKTLYAEEYRFSRPDGREVTILDQGQAIYDDSGLPTHMHGIIIDRTEQGELERQIREREELFRDMAENITEVFWLTDYEANRILYMSPQYERLFGMTVQSVYEDAASWSAHIHPEDKGGIIEKFRNEAPKGTYDAEYRILHPEGRVIWLRDRAFPIRDEKGKVLRIAGISQDITKEKLLMK